MTRHLLTRDDSGVENVLGETELLAEKGVHDVLTIEEVFGRRNRRLAVLAPHALGRTLTVDDTAREAELAAMVRREG